MPRLLLWSSAHPATLKQAIGTALYNCGMEFIQVPIGNTLPKMQHGDVVLGMGQQALEIIQKASLLPKGRKIGSMRGKELKLHSGKCSMFFTYSPSIIEVDYGKKPELLWDVKLCIRKALTGKLQPVLGEYKWVDDFTETISEIKRINKETKHPVEISIDLETVGLDPWTDGVFIVSISVTFKNGQAHLIRFDSANDDKQPAGKFYDTLEPNIQPINVMLLKQIKWLVDSKIINLKGANFKFDMNWMQNHWGITKFSSFKMDTTLVGSLLDENRSNSLNNHAKIYTRIGGYDDEFNAKIDKSRMDLVNDTDLLNYAGGDTDAGLQVGKSLKKLLGKDTALRNFYIKLLHPATKAIQIMEQRGMVVDVAQYEVLRHQVQEEITRTSNTAKAFMPMQLRVKHSKTKSPIGPSMIKDYLFNNHHGLKLTPIMVTEKTGKPSTAMEHIIQLSHKKGKKYEKVKELVELLSAYNSASKTMSTYIVGFLKHLRTDGKFHPTYMLHKGEYGDSGDDAGTVTGRTSAKDPAYQTIPKHTIWAKPLRTVYTPPKDMVILNGDYSQGELRVMACISNEENMLNAYRKGIDMHLITGASVYGIELEEALAMKAEKHPDIKMIRQGGKAGNFGLIYGMSAEGFVIYAKKTYGVDLTLKEAVKFRDTFFEQNPRILMYHEEYIAYAHANGFVRSPLGRIRHLPLINSYDRSVVAKQERQAINAPVQSTLSDIGLYAIAKLSKKYPELWVNGFTHDSITAYVPKDEVQLWAHRMKDTMENLPLKKVFGWNHQIPFSVDIEIGINNMAELEELELENTEWCD